MLVEMCVKLIRETHTMVNPKIKHLLKLAANNENNKIANLLLLTILENIEIAEKNSLPICQDTGLPIFFVSCGVDYIKYDFKSILAEAIIKATKEVPLRSNVVNPLTRDNTENNTGMSMPYIYFEEPEKSVDPGNYLKITYMPKGAGSENMSQLKMLKPSEGIDGMISFVSDVVVGAAGNPCPPVIVGVGLGGSFDISAYLAKKALLRDIGRSHPNNDISELESKILENINKKGKGVMGMGGLTTALSVQIEMIDTHTAMLPVAVNIQCWAHRCRHFTVIGDNIEFGW